MRKLIFILFLFPLSLAAQEFITIPDKDASALKQYKINWYTGIDPVQIKDGSWVLNIEVIDLIPANLIIIADEKELISNLKEYLISKPKSILRESDFKVPENEAIELIK